MKIRKNISLPLLAACFLMGCTSRSNPAPQPETTTPAVTNTTAAKPETMTPKELPVLSIVTINTDPNALDFVTKPVARHVSEQIATWTPNYVMPPEPYYETCRITLTDTDGTVLTDGAQADVKVRGNWTTTYDKKGLRIKFPQKQNLLGLNDNAAAKNWLLMAEYKDASMLRNRTALTIARELLAEDGLYAADTELVEVEINGEYWGVYLLTEQQQIQENRVAITEAAKDYTGTDIGYFMEMDGYFTNEPPLQQFHVDYAENAPLTPFDGTGGSGKTITALKDSDYDRKKDIGITIKSDIYSQQQHDFIASFVNHVYDIMYAAAYEDTAYVFSADYSEIRKTTELTPREAVEQVVDIRSLVDLYIMSELTCDADIYWSSFFLSADFGIGGNKKLTFTAPWDFDSAMGNKDRCADGTGFYAANIVPDVNGNEYETVNPWLTVLIYEDWMQEMIREKWTAAYDSGIFSRAQEQLESDYIGKAAAFERNYEKWDNIRKNDSFRMELSKEAAGCRTHQEAAEFLAGWLTRRITFLNEHWHL